MIFSARLANVCNYSRKKTTVGLNIQAMCFKGVCMEQKMSQQGEPEALKVIKL